MGMRSGGSLPRATPRQCNKGEEMSFWNLFGLYTIEQVEERFKKLEDRIEEAEREIKSNRGYTLDLEKRAFDRISEVEEGA